MTGTTVTMHTEWPAWDSEQNMIVTKYLFTGNFLQPDESRSTAETDLELGKFAMLNPSNYQFIVTITASVPCSNRLVTSSKSVAVTINPSVGRQ